MKKTFSARSTTYTCENCGKLTRDTGRGECDGFCWNCTITMEYENQHNDEDHDGEFSECEECQTALKSELN